MGRTSRVSLSHDDVEMADYPAPARVRTSAPSWWRILLLGLVLWIASVIVTGLTGSLNLIPTVVMLGSFLIPVTAVIWYLDHYQSPAVTGRQVLYAFILGGVLGVLAASILEAYLLSPGPLLFSGVGLIEELSKLLALYIIARNLPTHTVRDGIVLGASVGFGFAALESSGYALTALIVLQGHQVYFSLANLVFTELLRGILAPVGHGLWTGIAGGVLFGASRNGRLRLFALPVIGAYLGVSILHGLYDSMSNIALFITALLSGSTVNQLNSGQVAEFVVVQVAGIVVISLIGLIWLFRLWRRGAAEHANAIALAGSPVLQGVSPSP